MTQAPSNEARLPKVSPKAFEAFNFIDTCLDKAPLSRQEHRRAEQCILHLLARVEELEATEQTHNALVAQLRAPSDDKQPSA